MNRPLQNFHYYAQASPNELGLADCDGKIHSAKKN
jgi:hypothetical protein